MIAKLLFPIVRVIVVNMLISALAKMVVVFMNWFDAWLLTQVRSTKSEIDDVFYEAFAENRKTIEASLQKLVEMLKSALS
jgi:16S rRNA A1518/A1519 N6-dimethyltransferase RsmA/KsgA/DIM1 with predicted DNA glycosylase/AP lyase activity